MMPLPSVVIRGFASRYETLSRGPITYTDELPGIVSAGAFHDTIALNLPVQLIFGGHESTRPALADTDNGTLMLFDSPHGLCFEAELYSQECAELPTIVRELKNGYGCSVDYQESKLTATTVNGQEAWRTETATCSHVALVPDPLYSSACCWIADRPIDSQNHRVLLAQGQWNEAYHAHCLVLAESLKDKIAPVFDMYAEARRKLTMGTITKKGGVLSSPNKQPSSLRMTADLFALLFKHKDTMQAQIAALEARLDAMEADSDGA